MLVAPGVRLKIVGGATSVGASATAATVTLTVAVELPPLPSEIV
jgi:hypothetical protein